MTPDDVKALETLDHASWAAGDCAAIAERIEDVAAAAVEAAGQIEGMDLLDVATGTGNAALRAAERGAHAIGLDLAPELFATARERAAAMGVEVEWLQGDAGALPFRDASFDRVLSTCGIQFAPRHAAVAGELVRVLRPGGRFVLCNWTSDGMIGELIKLAAGALPQPPPFASPPLLWGHEAHVRELFAQLPVRLAFAGRSLRLEFGSPDAYVDFFAENYGPLVKALEAARDRSRLDADVRALAARFFRDGAVEHAYWVITGDRTG